MLYLSPRSVCLFLHSASPRTGFLSHCSGAPQAATALCCDSAPMRSSMNVPDILEADRQAHKPFADAMCCTFFWGVGRMGHAGRVLDQAFGIAQADGALDHVAAGSSSRCRLVCRPSPRTGSCRRTVPSAAGPDRLGQSSPVPDSGRFALPGCASSARATSQRRLAVPLDPQFQRLEPAQDQHRGEGRHDRARHVLQPNQAHLIDIVL